MAQGNIIYHLVVFDKLQKPIENLSVMATETSSSATVEAKTNDQGLVVLELNNGKEWKMKVGIVDRDLIITAVPFQITQMQEMFLYDIEMFNRKAEQNPNRTNAGYQTIKQTATDGTQFEELQCMAKVLLTDPTKKVLAGQTVRLVNIKSKTIFEDVTDKSGKAIFIVPNASKYEIDVNENKNFHFIDFADEYAERNINLEYAPTIVNEEIKGDTIFQKNNSAYTASMDRALMKIKVLGGSEGGKNENIYIKNIKTGKTYALKSDANGMVYALLPVQQIYLVDFEFEKNVDAINLTNSKQMTVGNRTFAYNPDPRLQFPEKFIPTPDKLFVKSFKEFLTKKWEKPKDKPVEIRMFAANKINKTSQEALFKITIAGSKEYGISNRLPMNVVLVLDQSGSMYSENRSELLKKALWDLGNVMTDEDEVSIVLFDSEANVVQHSTKDHLKGFEEIIEKYSPTGSTNIFKGLQIGAAEAMIGYDENKSNIIILLTDGYGSTSPKTITDFTEEQYLNGLQFSTIGLGRSFNQSLLELIAEKGRGRFSFADKPDVLSEVFLKEVKVAFSILAKDVTVEITHDDHLEFTQLMGYPVSNKSNGKVTFNIPKVPRGMNDLAFIKFKIKKAIEDVQAHPIHLKVSYTDMSSQKKVSYEEDVNLEWTDETDTELLLDQHEQLLYCIAIMNQTLKVMAENHAAGNDKAAKLALKDGIKQAKAIFPDAKPKEVKAIFEDMEKYYLQFELIEKKK